MATKKSPSETSVGYRSTTMGTGYEQARKQGGGIVPGANVQKEVPLGNPLVQIPRIIRSTVGRFGRKRSPSHVAGD